MELSRITNSTLVVLSDDLQKITNLFEQYKQSNDDHSFQAMKEKGRESNYIHILRQMKSIGKELKSLKSAISKIDLMETTVVYPSFLQKNLGEKFILKRYAQTKIQKDPLAYQFDKNIDEKLIFDREDQEKLMEEFNQLQSLQKAHNDIVSMLIKEN